MKNELSKLEEVSEVYSVSGEYDILIKLWAHSIEELNEIMNSKIRSVDGVEDLTEMIVMERVKDGVIPQYDPNDQDEDPQIQGGENLYLSDFIKKPVISPTGEKVGKLKDVIVSSDHSYPIIKALKVNTTGKKTLNI